jgi:2'-5' RNA ligase
VTGIETFRAFFAVPFAPAAAEALEAAARERLAAPDLAEAGGWRATPAERIHLTLKFLGDVPRESAPALEAALGTATAAAAPFPVGLGGWVLLPGRRDPRVLAVGVSDPTGSLPRLSKALEERASSLGFAEEARPFFAHVTVARRRPGRGRARTKTGGGGAGRGMSGVPPPASGFAEGTIVEDTVGRVVLMKSTLGPDGPAYAVVAEAVLGR